MNWAGLSAPPLETGISASSHQLVLLLVAAKEERLGVSQELENAG